MDPNEEPTRADEIRAELKSFWQEYRAISRPSSNPAPNDFYGKEMRTFYAEKIWPLLKELWQTDEFRREHLGGTNWNFVASIHTLGKSREPSALAALAAGAPAVYVFHTEESGIEVPWIEEQLGKRVKTYLIDKDDLSIIYEKVQEIVRIHPKGAIAFDMTGGTKAMSAGLAAAAFFLQEQNRKAPVIYVDNKEYDDVLRRPVAGSEFPVQLPNPYSALGVLAEYLAKERYRVGNYAQAQVEYEKIAKQTGDSKFYKPFAILTRCYAQWYALNIDEAQSSFAELCKNLEEDRSFKHPLRRPGPFQKINLQLRGLTLIQKIIDGCQNRTRQGAACLEALANREAASWLVGTFKYLGANYYSQERHNQPVLAALAIYRGLELVMQHLLAQRGVLAEQFSWDKLPPGTKESVIKLGEQVKNGAFTIPDNPWPIALTDGYLVLWVLNDQVVHTAFKEIASRINNPDSKTVLATLRGASSARNESLLIHGFAASGAEIGYLGDILTQLYEQLSKGILCQIEPIDLRK